MDKPSPVDDERWRAEAAGVTFGDDDLLCLGASISPDGSQLIAVYTIRATATNVTVRLARDTFHTVGARAQEVHRQLAYLVAHTG